MEDKDITLHYVDGHKDCMPAASNKDLNRKLIGIAFSVQSCSDEEPYFGVSKHYVDEKEDRRYRLFFPIISEQTMQDELEYICVGDDIVTAEELKKDAADYMDTCRENWCVDEYKYMFGFGEDDKPGDLSFYILMDIEDTVCIQRVLHESIKAHTYDNDSRKQAIVDALGYQLEVVDRMRANIEELLKVLSQEAEVTDGN